MPGALRLEHNLFCLSMSLPDYRRVTEVTKVTEGHRRVVAGGHTVQSFYGVTEVTDPLGSTAL